MIKRVFVAVIIVTALVGYSSADTNSFLQWLAGLSAPQTSDSGKFLKADGTWDLPSAGSVAWGGITGTLSNQTDLQTALDAKAATNKAQLDLLMATGTWTNMPAADTVFLGAWTNATHVDLTLFTQVRLVLNKLGTAGAASSVIRLRYRTAYNQTIANYSAIGSSEVQVAANTTNTMNDSGWIDLVAGAKADVYVVLDGVNGDGVLDPVFGNIHVQFR